MITRAQMPRQLRNMGGITNAVPREKYGLGSKIKERFRKLIPNELADIAVKAAPFVAMIPGYGPATAALMRGIGRFDQRGSISDAVKQGLGTYAGGKVFDAGMRGVGLRDQGARGIKQFFNEDTMQKGRGLFQGNKIEGPPGGGDPNMTYKKPLGTTETKGFDPIRKAADKVFDFPGGDKLPSMVKQKLLVGSITSGASALYSYFAGEFDEPQQPGETVGEYMARRNARVKQQVRMYMDSYYTPLRNSEYASLTPEQRDNFIDGIVGQTEIEGTTDYQGETKATGGRVGYQTGGITMANTLAENIRRNVANQAAINQKLQQARTKLPTGITRTKSGYTTSKPTIDPTGMLPQTSTLNPDLEQAVKNARAAGRNKEYIDTMLRERQDDQAINFFKSQQPLSLENVDQTGMPRTITQDDIDTFNFTDPMLVDSTDPMLVGFDYSKEINWSPGQPAPEGYRVINMMGDEFLERKFPSKQEIARLPMPLMGPGMMPPLNAPEDPDAGLSGQEYAEKYGIPYAKGGRVRFSEGANLKIKLKQIGYEDTLLDTMSLKELRELLDSEKGTFTDQGTYREPAKKGGMPTGIMRSNQAGVMERDYRDEGGFVPVGIKEKADDVPAMLSKNEFVFTADAVRGAGNGSIEKGAQKMYDTMKNLERRVV